MRPILSASGTYLNYPLSQWLEEKRKPPIYQQICINEIFGFTSEVRDMSIKSDLILVSYNVSSLFTNVALKETKALLVEKAFNDVDWLDKTHNMQFQKHQLAELLEIATTTNQLFQFNGELYERKDGVAIESP